MTKSTFIRKREAVNRVIQRYRSNYLQREESADVGRKYKFIWWLSPDTAPAPVSRRVILNIGVKEFKLFVDTNERATLVYLLP